MTREATSETIFDQVVRYLQTEERKPGDYSEGSLAYRPEFAGTPPLREPGRYIVTDKRHPWMQGHLFVVDNPYVAATAFPRYHPLLNFEIGAVPPGTHTVEVWHPLYQPVKKTYTVKIEADKTTELMIEFIPPT
jgi:hypothetical protein